MSKQMAVALDRLQVKNEMLEARVDKLAKALHLVTKSLSVLERSTRTISDETVVPQAPLPASLRKLEIGKQPEGT